MKSVRGKVVETVNLVFSLRKISEKNKEKIKRIQTENPHLVGVL